MKLMLKELKKRFLNRATLAAIAAYLIGKAFALGYIPNIELANGLQELVSVALDVLVVGGILNNAGLGKGFKDNEQAQG